MKVDAETRGCQAQQGTAQPTISAAWIPIRRDRVMASVEVTVDETVLDRR
jgi:hypothetical protein